MGLIPKFLKKKSSLTPEQQEIYNNVYNETFQAKMNEEFEKQVKIEAEAKAVQRGKKKAERVVWGKKGRPVVDTSGKPKSTGITGKKILSTLATMGGNVMYNLEADFDKHTRTSSSKSKPRQRSRSGSMFEGTIFSDLEKDIEK